MKFKKLEEVVKKVAVKTRNSATEGGFFVENDYFE